MRLGLDETGVTELMAIVDHVRGLNKVADGLFLEDDRGARANLDSSFGTLLANAVRVHTGLDRRVWIEPPVVAWEAGGLAAPAAEDVAARFALRDGALVRVSSAP